MEIDGAGLGKFAFTPALAFYAAAILFDGNGQAEFAICIEYVNLAEGLMAMPE